MTSPQAPRVLTEDLGGSPLSRAAREGRFTPEWFPARLNDADAWRKRAREVAAAASPGWLDALSPALAPAGAAAERLTRVVREHGVVVTTGQQPGFLGGPLMTLVKALSAIALADVIEKETGVATAPLFWAATDDADFEESRGIQVAIVGGVDTLRIEQAPRAGTTMSRAALGDVSGAIARMVDACGSVVDERVLEVLRASYHPSATIGDAYVSFLRALLQPLGMPVLDASHASVRRASAPLLRRALERASDVNGALEQRNREIVAAGLQPQVDSTPGLSLVFTNEGGEKRRLPISETAQALRSTPVEELSPNVLLRPVLERSILPTVAYVAGPGELAYFAQVSAVAQALGAAGPLAVPRWSATIVEPRVARLLERLRLDLDELRDPHAVESRLAHALLPRPVSDAVRDLRRDVERGVAALEVADDDALVPPASLQGLRRWLLHRLERLERRYGAAIKKRETQLMRDVATARGALFPEGVRQERALAFAPFLARYGESLVGEMLAQATSHAQQLVVGSAIGVPAERARATSRS